MMRYTSTWILCLPLLISAESGLLSQEPATRDFSPKVLIAHAAYHPRKQHPTIYFYHHDGESQGKVIGEIRVEGKRSDYHPSLSLDGRWCAFASEQENETSRIFLWDLREQKLVDLPDINASPNAQLHATMSGDGKLVAYAAWSHPEGAGRWDVLLYDAGGKRPLAATGLNEQPLDERMPALSGDGRTLAFTSNAKDNVGGTDIYFYDVSSGQTSQELALNSPRADIEPSLSLDGKLVAFVSDRRGGAGGRDLYLYDRNKQQLVDLPNLNSIAHEQSPSLSADGRYIAFVSERSSGEGERDIFIYDRSVEQLLAAPGLNGKYEDLDPCVIVLP
jgi:Tol biopolymer transport system component